ncbi:MAG: response regulator [Spirochaetales bacterium]|nr:response regulator [Spirochaetales bacterium]
MFGRSSIRLKIAFIVCAVFLLTLVAYTLVLEPVLFREGVDEAAQNQLVLTEAIARSIDFVFRQGKKELESVARLPGVVSMEKRRLDETLALANATTQFYNYFFVLDTQARWVSYPLEPRLINDRIPPENMVWVDDTFSRNETVFVNVVQSKVHTLVSGFSTPIRNAGGVTVGLLRGVLVVSDENTAGDIIKDLKIGEHGFAFLTTANGLLLSHPNIAMAYERFSEYDFTEYPPVQRLARGESGVMEYPHEGETRVAAYWPVATTGWGVVVEQPKSDIDAVVRRSTGRFTYILVGLFSVFFAVFMFVFHRSLQPLSGLLAQIKTGSFSRTDRFPKNEIGTLAKGFKSLFEALYRSREETRERTAYIQSIYEATRYVAFVAGDFRDGGVLIREFSRGAEMLFGYAKSEVLDRPLSILHPGAAGDVLSGRIEATRTAGETFSCDAELARKSGETFPAFITIQPVVNEHGVTTGLLEVALDMTERRRMEREKALLEERYHQAQKMESIGRLVGGVAHDLNNLLTPVLGYGEILIENFPPEDPRRISAEEVVAAGTRARDLVRQLLTFGRKLPHDYAQVDLNRIISDFQNLLRHTIRENIEIKISAGPGILPIMADAVQIEQVIMNLAINAADSMIDGGRLTIATSAVELDEAAAARLPGLVPGEYALLSVSDTGAGMDEETIKHVFDPFFTTKGRQNTGLGLTTVYGIVTQHGGLVEAQSEPGRGTVFRVYLPVNETVQRREPEPDREPASDGGSETILVAEDNEHVRRLVRNILTRKGYTVLAAESGEDALTVLDRHRGPIHLLLTDVILRGMNGRELCSQVRDRLPAVPVLYMSGYTDDILSDRRECGENEAFIQKPFSAEAITKLVGQLLRRKPK